MIDSMLFENIGLVSIGPSEVNLAVNPHVQGDSATQPEKESNIFSSSSSLAGTPPNPMENLDCVSTLA
ncbi:hypothetical protein DEO72_LG10g1410 [Vigna unguiculata]|uniref:Uncharacterized protein n=1 Tax=Vigna unguiculata TaxID=3917 RepID=A0A4D6NBS5_VIGUN|nr:hypothetical protein DEO72_LG10g1410 [Vigna unguiculata]